MLEEDRCPGCGSRLMRLEQRPWSVPALPEHLRAEIELLRERAFGLPLNRMDAACLLIDMAGELEDRLLKEKGAPKDALSKNPPTAKKGIPEGQA
jgi:hypothetical protein